MIMFMVYVFTILNILSCNNSSDTSLPLASGPSTPPDSNGTEDVNPSTNVPYKFHEEITKAGTAKINGKEYELVYFGDWPQSLKSKDVIVDEATAMTQGYFTYYKGNDENWYVKCKENVYAYGLTYSDGITEVQQASSNSFKYFKVEPIKWRILSTNYDGKKLLLAESILTGGIPYYLQEENRTIDFTKIYPSNYKYSTIRAFLNGVYEQDDVQPKKYDGKGFLQTAFSLRAQDLIQKTSVDNSARSTVQDSSENNIQNYYASDTPTYDKIFLLSEQEVTKAEFGFEKMEDHTLGNVRVRYTPDYAKANYVQFWMSDMAGWWWLRSPYDNNAYTVRSVYNDGRAYSVVIHSIDYTYGGIVPALCVSN